MPASVETPATGRRAEATPIRRPRQRPCPSAEPRPAATRRRRPRPASPPRSRDRRLGERLRRIAPFFAGSRRGFVLAFIGAIVAAATEPAIPALLKVLLDDGMKQSAFPLWAVPIAVVGLTLVRGVGRLHLAVRPGVGRQPRHAGDAPGDVPARARRRAALFTRNTASNLVNTLTFEVQNGANQLVYSLQSLVGDSLRFLALLGYLVWLNWQLTMFVAVLLPAVAYVMRKFSRRLHRVTVEGQHSIDELAYVVEENVLAWRSVRLHAAPRPRRRRASSASASSCGGCR